MEFKVLFNIIIIYYIYNVTILEIILILVFGSNIQNLWKVCSIFYVSVILNNHYLNDFLFYGDIRLFNIIIINGRYMGT